jgi:hypothetical protein
MPSASTELKSAATYQVTAAEVRAAIQKHFGTGGERYSVLFEVRNGTGWRADRSVDAVVMALWPSLGLELHGMEIKVHRGDWLAELKRPEKASRMFEYFDRWFLVAPEYVVKLEEIPRPWGWYVPTEKGLRLMREAKTNVKPHIVDRNFLAALLRRVAKTDDAFVQDAVEEAVKKERETMNVRVEERALRMIGDQRERAESWKRLETMITGKPDEWLREEDVLNAIRIVYKSGITKTYSNLRDLQRAVDGVKKQLDAISADLELKVK